MKLENNKQITRPVTAELQEADLLERVPEIESLDYYYDDSPVEGDSDFRKLPPL